jgi:acyl dehydratase
MKKTNWYFEDFFPGQEIALGSRTVSEEEIIAFATQFDPQPFHVDHDAAAASIFKGVIASGWHTCSMMMRLVVDNLISATSSMGSPGLDAVRWLLPVRAGYTLTVTYLTTAVKASASRPDRGVVWSTCQAVNQNGQLVCTIEGMGMFGRRPSGEEHA